MTKGQLGFVGIDIGDGMPLPVREEDPTSELASPGKGVSTSLHNHTTVYPNDTEGLHRLACYLHRAPVNLSRLRYHSESGLLIYEPKAGQEVDDGEPIDPLEFIARVLIVGIEVRRAQP